MIELARSVLAHPARQVHASQVPVGGGSATTEGG